MKVVWFQEVTEVAETQDPNLAGPLPVPETDPALFGLASKKLCDDLSFEIPETQPNEVHYPESVDLDFFDPVRKRYFFRIYISISDFIFTNSKIYIIFI